MKYKYIAIMESDNMTREDNIKFIVDLTNKNKHIKQYNRLIKNSLFPEEDFDCVYENLMEYMISLEEYEKCSELLKLKKQK